ncbi:lycopene cyclase domain-containing protein [Brachybacterium sp. YJGR34]|uniref:lycopene cyclase domain-containing protein n=1 Tax=Brachybacterium sp. YJGR34 TaxID=2059911 RepID=UPI000E09E488|nr:lycopene cyclase domain-containing protein [Brachybacterium sp. YJGR34]
MTYAALATLFLLPPLLLIALVAVLRRPGRRWWAATALTVGSLTVLTLVFDSLMIAADLFRYEPSLLSGVRIGLVPVEDLAWPVAAGLLLPALWLLATPAEKER